jgi:hypothetical protein
MAGRRDREDDVAVVRGRAEEGRPAGETSAKPTPLRAGTMMAPTFGCWPLSGKPLVVTAVRAAREDGAGGDRCREETLLISSPMRF